ncbi:TrpB-like pyridoxal phosphate-dependent enzyme [Paenibacillus athensensis]|uniref:tryptophan synthase n=1 Tax=Paenibacillus athensensis TaxID=1967502 RepID=A0A4Y8Q7I8_9BACL|nr:TrpB-like pyridoxal phosphate-dependent enzyme [Paenibacillus athensensis]MCD1257290.1 TrpB-like pyridoxal phosphate-dependent enzyme [Paenibacillus athensensis]
MQLGTQVSDPRYRFDLAPEQMPEHWYNILADLDFELPPDLPPPVSNHENGAFKMQVPMEIIRQSIGKMRYVPIPEEVRNAYRQWRPTPVFRAVNLEKALGTSARIYFKYEGGNTSGSHKLNTAIAQAYYYKKAGVKRLTTGTGAGQWGTALSAACHMFGMECKVYMVGISYQQKPYRRSMMKLYGADVVASPSTDTRIGRELLEQDPGTKGNIALAIAEALEDANSREDTRFCIGSGENYSILHQTIIGMEAQQQMEMAGYYPDVVVASLGAGSNFGGITLPFLSDNLTGKRSTRFISVEPAACPKLSRGEYRYDYTDFSGVTPLEKMYTLGHNYVTPDIHAGGLRYHATSKLVSALYDRGYLEAVAYQQRDIFNSGALFCREEGILPAPESAHAVHGAVMEAIKAREAGTSPTILALISGHGYFDMTAYESYMAGNMQDVHISDEQIQASLRTLPVVEEEGA